MTKSILSAAVGAFLLAGTALAGPVQTKPAKTSGAKTTAHHAKKHKGHHSSKKTDMSQKAS
jgi:hypothetical protein